MSDHPKILNDLGQLSMTEIIRYQGVLQQELMRRFERQLALVFSDIVGSTPYFARFGDAAGRQLQQLHCDLLHVPVKPGARIQLAGAWRWCCYRPPPRRVKTMGAPCLT